MATIKQVIECELPAKYAELAISNIKEHLLDTEADDLPDAITCSFVWSQTKQLYDFWSSVVKSYELNKPLPPIVQLPGHADCMAAYHYYTAKATDKFTLFVDGKTTWRNQYMRHYTFDDGSCYAIGHETSKELKAIYEFQHKYAKSGKTWLATGCFGHRKS